MSESRFYSEPLGMAEYRPASVTFHRNVELPGFLAPWRLVIVCAAGQAPKVSMGFAFAPGGLGGELVSHGAPLSFDQWVALRDAVGACWAQIQIRCMCGHPWGCHGRSSPHGCSDLSGCACDCFAAAEPLVSETNRLTEK
jgi:hypothetical protein